MGEIIVWVRLWCEWGGCGELSFGVVMTNMECWGYDVG